MKNNKTTKEFQEINKNLSIAHNDLKEQNKKTHEINEKLADTDLKTNIAHSYLSGFSSIFGFFPKLFSSNKKKQQKEEKETDDKIENLKVGDDKLKEINNVIHDEYDDLEREIFELNKNAKEINNEINKSKKGIEILNKKIEKTGIKVEQIKKEAEKIIKK